MEEYLFEMKEYEKRKSELLQNLNDIDIAIIFNRPDLFYYSGTGIPGIIIADNQLTRYSFRNLELAKKESRLKTKPMDSFRLFKKLGNQSNAKSIGLELELIPFRTAKYIQEAFGNPKLVNISPITRMIRSRKSKAEQEMMKRAAKQTDESFEYIRDKIKPGKTELEIAADIEHFLRRQGHPGWVNVHMFNHALTSLAYVMAGESTASLNNKFGPVSGQGVCKMHKNGPSNRKIKKDEAVLIDTTGVYEGYTGDETRTFFTGSPPDILLDAYEAAKEVQKKCKNWLRPGMKPSDLYNKLNDLVKEMGFEENFMGFKDDKVPFVGHGIGLELDEFPIITDKYDNELESGNIIAIEPKFIFENPKTGVGLEDSWIIHENTAERITKTQW